MWWCGVWLPWIGRRDNRLRRGRRHLNGGWRRAAAETCRRVRSVLAVSLLSVRERHAEIGLRLAVGALPRQVMVQFLSEAAMIAVLGALSGLFVGGIGIILGQWLMGWQMQITGLNTLYSMLVPLGLALASGAWPALRAARLDPMHALRG